jgi:dolichyl-phosphate beta-glucosyltransferase
MNKLAVVIPCYNEEKRLQKQQVLNLISKDTFIEVYLANDGSTDNTVQIIKDITNDYENIQLINFDKNEGKAQTIYKSFLQLQSSNKFTHFGYLDADFSTDSRQFLEMFDYLSKTKKQDIFGSRISTLNSNIDRKVYRHLIGRTIITFINFFYNLGVYDTQCGAKIFSKQIMNIIIIEKFKTNWLFDIEIFIRLSNAKIMDSGIEYPLKYWKDISGSKIKKTDFFYIMYDIVKLIKVYK